MNRQLDQTKTSPKGPFSRLGLPARPVMLAPLAGVSDSPFRRVCYEAGADLCYVEMLSAVALNHRSPRTLEMMERHPDERVVGVQVTSGSAAEMGEAVRFLNDQSFETIDINMGCPVRKVVRSGSGSAILRDVKRVYETTEAARKATDKPLSVKIRLGWDASSRNYLEVGKAAQDAGADWLTVHGRTRNDDYSVPVDICAIQELKSALGIPVVGNGNILSAADAEQMQRATGVDGMMVSRGSFGNPWIFRAIKKSAGADGITANPLASKAEATAIGLQEWVGLVVRHLDWQFETYGDRAFAAVCMRKHLLWYLKGWPGAKKIRNSVSLCSNLAEARQEIMGFARELAEKGVERRVPPGESSDGATQRYLWDPKYEMDRKLDRGGYEDLQGDEKSPGADGTL